MKKHTVTRGSFLQTTGAATVAALVAGGRLWGQGASGRPNILWITCEDMSPDLGCYGDNLVHTPNIDRLASQGIRFTHTFTTAPVCSASRSAFWTGMYQTSIGAHNHRSHRDDGYTLPDGVDLLPHYFRQAGYFTAAVREITTEVRGNCKTDFNFKVEQPFDGTHWNQRQEGQPFFAYVNFQEAHRGRAWIDARKLERRIDPHKVTLPPYYVDHPVVRDDWANYLDSINLLDIKVGAVLDQLEADGLADNTIVIFFSDHGRCLFRGKQFLWDAGIHVPLIVRWPGKFNPGQVDDRMVSAIDITATSLKLAGIEPPPQMEGRVFLGPDPDPAREYIVAARDRCDETVDRIRAVRTRRYKYIRNYYPERSSSQLNRYKESQYPPLPLMRKMNDEGQLSKAQSLFFTPTRPREELYDLEADPYEVHNLANSRKHRKIRKKLEQHLDNWIEETGDQGAIPEPQDIIDAVEAMQNQKYKGRL